MQLPQPFSVLAPMEDVTDTVFRQMVASIAKPDVFVTEFVNVDGVVHAIPDFKNTDLSGIPVLRRLVFTESERPILAQIWGSNPEKFFEATSYIKYMGFDGIDINMGCPQRDVMKCGGGSALIGDNIRVNEIVAAVKRAAPGLPISVKTRIGNEKIITKEWISFLLELDLDMITVHLRTAAEQSGAPAHWAEMHKIVELRHKCKIIGNGDVKNYQEGKSKCEEFGCDGFMIGRGVLTNPAAFSKDNRILSIEDRIQLLRKHIDMWGETWGNKKDFQILKKFVKAYINGFEGAVKIRAKFMEAKNLEELKKFIV